jgi:primosomal protein N' (replication factor Y)
MGARHLRCHHCLATQAIPYQCPQCKSRELIYSGAGTERIEQSLQQHFPNTPVFRIDRDTTSQKNAMSTMLDNIQQQKAAILVGTQMLAKGHHFPDVTLVLVVDADGALMGTDYRAIERFGQLLTQVTGRAGREQKPGIALIQTHYPNHGQLHKLLMHGYHRFAMDLLAERQQLQLPPFSYQALIRLEDMDAHAAQQTLQQLQRQIPPDTCQSLGPFPASLQRRAHYYRFQLLLQAPQRAALKQAVTAIIKASEKIVKPHKQRWSIDIDPQDMS